MGPNTRRVLLAAFAGSAVFALAVAAGLWLNPEPRTQVDYLVIGSVATFLMLGVIFGLVLVLWIKPRNLLVQRRPKHPEGQETPPE